MYESLINGQKSQIRTVRIIVVSAQPLHNDLSNGASENSMQNPAMIQFAVSRRHRRFAQHAEEALMLAASRC
jgi:hypothetical protein